MKSSACRRPDIAFSEEDNQTDSGSEFVFWSTADLIVYEADRAGSNVGIDTDTDEWVQTVRLDHPGPAQDEYTVGIGKPKPPAYLCSGRSDTDYRLTYSLAPHRVQADPSVLDEIRNFDSRSDRLKRFQRRQLREGQGALQVDLFVVDSVPRTGQPLAVPDI